MVKAWKNESLEDDGEPFGLKDGKVDIKTPEEAAAWAKERDREDEVINRAIAMLEGTDVDLEEMSVEELEELIAGLDESGEKG